VRTVNDIPAGTPHDQRAWALIAHPFTITVFAAV